MFSRRWTAPGAVLLGLGASLNRACVLGAIARVGSGEWAYLATAFGFYLGCLLRQATLAHFPLRKYTERVLALQALMALAWMLGACAGLVNFKTVQGHLYCAIRMNQDAIG